MLGLLGGFVAELRRAGLPVSVTEEADAAQALSAIDMGDRRSVKSSLGATLVKSSSHRPAFDTAFEVFFALRGPAYGLGGAEEQARSDAAAPPGGEGGQPGAGAGEALSGEELARLLYSALRAGDEAALRAVARQAVSLYAGMEAGRPVGGTYYIYRTLKGLELDSLLARLVAEARAAITPSPQMTEGEAAEVAPLGGPTSGELGPLAERLLRDEYRERLAALRREIEAEIRRRLVADRGSEALSRSVRKPLPEDVEFMHATREELALMQRAVEPLTRKLEARLARRRRHLRRGPLDFRATVHRSLAYGGVPAEPRFRHPKPSKPELFVVADISGSVAAFARFTLHLVYAIAAQFTQVRSFVFIDGLDEVSHIFESAETVGEAVRRVNTEADVVWVDGHSDYGHALTVFSERFGREVGPKTSIIVLGDARSNYHSPHAGVLGELKKRARHVYWLNPEPRAYWGSGDSVIEHYARFTDGVYECRNLRQLTAFVAELA